MDEAFLMGLMHGQFDSMSQGERMELRVRRIVNQIMEPEHQRIEEMLVKGASCRQVEADLPYTEADVTKRVLELMELAVTERVHEIDWIPELTPTTLRKVMQEMRKVKVPPMEDEPLKRLFLRMAMSDQQMINHNAFVTVTRVPEEPMYKSEARPGIVVTSHGPFVKEYRRATDTMPAHEVIEIQHVMTVEEIQEMLARHGALDEDDGVAGDS